MLTILGILVFTLVWAFSVTGLLEAFGPLLRRLSALNSCKMDYRVSDKSLDRTSVLRRV